LQTAQKNSVFGCQGVGYGTPELAVCIRNISDYSPFGVSLDGRTIEGNGYRYGYQGSERDDEAKGRGNSYTTFYRQLDTRVGRWFSIDPVYKTHLSPYNSMSNNPLIRVDPKGDDDYFDSKGNYLRSDNKATRIIHIINKKGIDIQLKDYVFTKNNSFALARIGRYYANEAKVGINDLSHGMLSVGNLSYSNNDGQLIYNYETFFNDGIVSADCVDGLNDVMNYNPKNNTITISLDDGKINPLLNDGNNFQNAIVHEKGHKKSKKDDNYEHLDVYLNQIDDKTWQNTTVDWKNAITQNINEIFSDIEKSFNANKGSLTKKDIEITNKYLKLKKNEFKKRGIDIN